MRFVILTIAGVLLAPAITTSAEAEMTVSSAGELKHYTVTIRRFDPARGMASGQEFVLPVNSPDEEHAIASTLANAASWPGKVKDGQPLPIAFMAVRVSPR